MKLSIIIPVYNEEKTIKEVLRRVTEAPVFGFKKEIIVVDDGSKDNSKCKMQNAKAENLLFGAGSDLSLSALQFKNQNLKIIEHSKNLGKGEAIKSGLKEATGDYVLIQDADLEYDTADYQKLLAEISADSNRLKADSNGQAVVYGSRNLKPTGRGYRHYYWGVKILTGLTNLLYGCRLTDIYTGYKLFPTALLKSLNLESSGFEFEAEVTVKILKSGVEIKEKPISYTPRKFEEGKKIRFKDGIIGFWTIIKCWLE